VGHLVELAQPETYDTKYSKWVYADLPIFPMNWQYEVSAGTKKTVWNFENMYAFQNQKRLIDDYMIKFVIEHEMLGTITT